jgi:hypothetical protein
MTTAGMIDDLIVALPDVFSLIGITRQKLGSDCDAIAAAVNTTINTP